MEKIKILVVDDELRVRDEIAEFLLENKYQVFKAGLPSEAFNILKQNDIDLVILDITDIENPVQVADYQTPGIAVEVAVAGEYIFVADEYSVMILRFTETGIVEEVGRIPNNFALSQNYPNPFNSSTNINYTLPHQSEVAIDIYDILGRHIETLVDETQPAGRYEAIWDAVDAASGIYFYKINAGDKTETKQMVLLK